MPLFKKKTEEEKLAKQQAKEEKLRQNMIEVREHTLENEIFPKMKNEKLIETIRALDFELSYVNLHEPFYCEAIARLEHILIDDLETLVGYARAERKKGNNSIKTLLTFTTTRLIFVDENNSHILSFFYDELNSIELTSEKIAGLEIKAMKLYINSTIYEVSNFYIEVAEISQAINSAKDEFMANPDNFEPVEVADETEVSVKDERSVTEQLNELKQLLYSRTITQEQYDTMKAKITGK